MKSIESIKDKGFLVILGEIKAEILKLFGHKLVRLVLYGSYARHQADSESDIDIMILVDESEEGLRSYRSRTVDIMTELSLKYDRVISFTRETYGRFTRYLDVLPFFRNVYEEGVEIYGKDPG